MPIPLRKLYELGIKATEAYGRRQRERVREFINAEKTKGEVVFHATQHREPEFDRVQLWFNQSESRR